jgi:mono/diheme cytochrome c family protein
MKKKLGKYLVLASMILVAPISAQELQIGKSLWESHCSPCHGEMGMSVLPLTPNIMNGEGIEKSHRQRLTIVRNGKGVMPAFAGELPDRLIVYIVDYMTTLYPKKSYPLEDWDPNL